MKSAEIPLDERNRWRREELIKLLAAEEEERTEADQQDLEEKEAATTSSTDVYMLSPQDKNMRALKDNILKQLMATMVLINSFVSCTCSAVSLHM